MWKPFRDLSPCAPAATCIALNCHAVPHDAALCSAVLWQSTQAQALLQQLERRNLYKFVSEVTLNYQAQQNYAAGGAGKPTAEEIVACQSTAETGVSWAAAMDMRNIFGLPWLLYQASIWHYLRASSTAPPSATAAAALLCLAVCSSNSSSDKRVGLGAGALPTTAGPECDMSRPTLQS
jgi:hypothetical protein